LVEYFAPDKSWVASYANLKPDYIAGTLYMEAATNNTNMTKDFVALKSALGVKLATCTLAPFSSALPSI
jgi:hypothetical protein